MKTLDVEQGSPEWIMARIGIPTASAFPRIITPARMAYSGSAPGYIAELLGEWALGASVDGIQGLGFADRGTEMEDEARAWYEFDQDVEVERVGFVLRDDGLVGGSPDGRVGTDGGVEIKCPSLAVHCKYLTGADDLAATYGPQVQGYMYLTRAEWWDVVSYHPKLPKKVVRVERDRAFCGALHRHLARFWAELHEAQRKLLEMGHVPPEGSRMPPPRPEPDSEHEAVLDLMFGVEADTQGMSEDEMNEISETLGEAVRQGRCAPEDRKAVFELIVGGEWGKARDRIAAILEPVGA